MEYTLIALFGNRMQNLLVDLKGFQITNIVLYYKKENFEEAKKYKNNSDLNINLVGLSEGNVWEVIFETVSKTVQLGGKFLINTSTGDYMTQCALTSAAFVNGSNAVSVENGMGMLLPALKFSYYKILTDRKMDILKILQNEHCESHEELAKKMNLSLPLLSYHINGNHKSEGLKELGLIETYNKNGKMAIVLTTLGKLLLKGYL